MAANHDDSRPNPDALLKEIQKEENKPGRLKIFLGYSPGVGKTYTMLEEAHLLKRRGDDVVVGIVETHKRAETAELLKDIEVVPRKSGVYHGITLEEMDLDAIRARKPTAVLVDELAHTNAPWARHPKRHLDVEELLDQGIDVYTTVNIQHFESQNDVIAKITGVRLQETVPDSLLQRADEVQVVDIPIEELFERLREGKVYIPEQAQRAMANFFQRGNLVALREITLSVAARKMDSELLNYMRAKAIRSTWATTDKLMLCIAASPHAGQLVRKAYRMAQNTNAEWYVVHITPPVLRNLTEQERGYLAEAFRLAEEFGARSVELTDPDVVGGLLRFARENNISQIIIGRPRKSLFRGALQGSPVYRLIRNQSEFDLYLVEPTVEEGRSLRENPRSKIQNPRSLDIRGYVAVLPTLAVATIINLLLLRYLEPVSLYAIYLVSIIIVALLFGTGPSVWASIISLLAYDFFFTEPKFTLAIKHPGDAVSALVFFLASIVIGQLIKGSRGRLLGLRARVEHVTTLEEMSKDLLALPPLEQLIGGLTSQPAEWRDTAAVLRTTILDDIGQTTVRYLGKAISEPAFVFFRGRDNRLQLWARSDSSLSLTPDEQAVAEWVLLNGEPAGAGTETLANVALYFMPMKSQQETIGVVGVKGSYEQLLPEQRHLMSAVSNLASLAAARWVSV
jgi:two-component system, OmpR family, sensor histidine kinase KdpD